MGTLVQQFEAAIPVTSLPTVVSEGDAFLWHYSVNRNYIKKWTRYWKTYKCDLFCSRNFSTAWKEKIYGKGTKIRIILSSTPQHFELTVG